MDVPTGGIKIADLSSFMENVGRCSHIAVYRPVLKIFHHYLVVEVKNNSMLIIHYIGNALRFASSGGMAKIREEEIQFTADNKSPNQLKSEHLNFKAGLYLVERREYPITENEKRRVIERARTRVGENEYKLFSNNCEFFVTWAMTGFGTCEQLDKKPMKRLLADVVDTTLSDRGNMISALLGGPAGAVIPIASRSMFLNEQKKNGQIDKRTHKREVTKNAIANVATAAGGLGGTVIGGSIVPIVGGFIGGVVGGLIGRISGTVVSGTVFDIVNKD